MKNKKPATTQQPDEKPWLRPKLRFPEFRNAEEWKVKAFAELFSIGNGRDHKHLSLGNIPVYGSGGYMRSVDEYLFDGESVCIGRKGTINNPMFLTGKFWTVDTLFYTHSFNQCLPKFVFSIFQSIDWLKHNEAGGVPSLSKTNIEKIETALPSLAEQQKIAECLSSVDELIAAQAQKLDALKTHKKGLMQQLFPREGETQPRLRFPEFQNQPGWKNETLGFACQMQAGKFVSASEIKEQNTQGLYPCYGGNGLRGYTATFTHSGKYSLIGRQGALCGNIKTGIGQFHATEHAVVVTPKTGIKGDWLFYLLDLLNLNRFATGQAQPGLSVDVLEKLPIAIPNQEPEQHKIADCLTSLDDLIAAQTQKLEALKSHKKGLMQQLFPLLEEVEA
jgi:type I restriction enzyme, S subunit